MREVDKAFHTDEEQRRRKKRKRKKAAEAEKGVAKTGPGGLSSEPEMANSFEKRGPHGAQVLKVDRTLGLVIGWAIVCTEMGQPYVDVQKHHIPAESMLQRTTDFMLKCRVSKEMHAGEAAGVVVHSFPVTAEIAKAASISCDREGWLIMVKANDSMLDKVESGEYTGFSIGGKILEGGLIAAE